MAKKSKHNPVETKEEHIELNSTNNNSSSNTTHMPAVEPSAWQWLNMCHGVTQYCTKENAILAGAGIFILGVLAGVATVIALFAFPKCKEYTFKSMIDSGVKVSGNPMLYKYDSITLEAPATKEENYKKEFTIAPDTWWENPCELNVKKDGLSKQCDMSGYQLEQIAFTCTWELKETNYDDDDTSTSHVSEEWIEAARAYADTTRETIHAVHDFTNQSARAMYSFFNTGSVSQAMNLYNVPQEQEVGLMGVSLYQ